MHIDCSHLDGHAWPPSPYVEPWRLPYSDALRTGLNLPHVNKRQGRVWRTFCSNVLPTPFLNWSLVVPIPHNPVHGWCKNCKYVCIWNNKVPPCGMQKEPSFSLLGFLLTRPNFCHFHVGSMSIKPSLPSSEPIQSVQKRFYLPISTEFGVFQLVTLVCKRCASHWSPLLSLCSEESRFQRYWTIVDLQFR